MNKIYKILLVIWLAIGTAVSGYFFIFPVKYRHYPKSEMDYQREEYFGPQYNNGKEGEVSLLVTIVGTILIAGLGRTYNNSK